MVSKTKKKLTFNETVKETGLGLAVIIFQDKLQKKFWDKLTFDQWVQIFRQVPSDSNLKNTALTKMLELASTFEHWHRIYKKHLLDEKTKKTALTQMLKLASNFDQCKEVLSEFDAPSKKERNMVLKMAEMASTFDQCLFICDVAYSRSKGKMIALKKMRKH